MRRLISFIFSILLTTAMFSSVAFAYTFEEASIQDLMAEPTIDYPSSWAVESVNQAVSMKLVPEELQRGYTQTITRAEYCALAVTLYESITGKKIVERESFTDTKDTNVEKLGGLGIVNGVGNNQFAPNAPLTREQAAIMLANLSKALGYPLIEKPTTFADKESISSWAVVAVGQMQEAKIMNGTRDNLFSPKNSYTREQSIITMMNVFNATK